MKIFQNSILILSDSVKYFHIVHEPNRNLRILLHTRFFLGFFSWFDKFTDILAINKTSNDSNKQKQSKQQARFHLGCEGQASKHAKYKGA